MKLKINGFENEIIFDDNNINILEINNSKLFSHIIETINNKASGMETNEIFLLNDNNEELDISKEIYMVFDLFNVEYNSKKVLSKLYNIISENISKNQDYEIENMTLNLRNYLIQEINELPFEFTINSDLEIVDVLKLFNLKIDKSNYTNVLQRVELLIDIISVLKIANILIIPNLKMFLDNAELVELYKYSLYNNVKLLLIEKYTFENLKYEKKLKIDENFYDEIN